MIEAAVSVHIGRRWHVLSTTDLADRSSHPSLVLRGADVAVFAKLATGPAGGAQVAVELAGLRLIAERSSARVPTTVAGGRVDFADGSAALLCEALEDRTDRRPADWRAIGHTLALLHEVVDDTFGRAEDGLFGPLRQDNRPVASNLWEDFYAVRRLQPWLRTARDAGAIEADTVRRIELLINKLPELSGPQSRPRLVHGDAQHHNFVSTVDGAVVIDPAPYFGHPELDLALVDYFAPVPPELWAGYRERRPIDDGFDDRRELWRIFAYLAVLTVDGRSEFGRTFRGRLDTALDHYIG